jgi:hypothetical protein
MIIKILQHFLPRQEHGLLVTKNPRNPPNAMEL